MIPTPEQSAASSLLGPLAEQVEALRRGLESAYAGQNADTSDLEGECQATRRALDRLEAEARGPGMSQGAIKNVALRILALEQQASWDLADDQGDFAGESQVEALTTAALSVVISMAEAAGIPLRLGIPRRGL